MARDSGMQFEVRLGRIRSPNGAKKFEGFLRKFSKATRTASRGRSRSGHAQRRAARSAFQRRVIVKAHLVRMDAKGAAAQRLHLDYIERDGAGLEGEPAHLYDNNSVDADKQAFLARGEDDRHQFRIIVSPEDASDLQDLTAYTRDLVSQMEEDLGTKLDWVAANHYDTGQPHTHLVIRGKRDDGTDLVIPREYIKSGIRQRAQELAELELGPVTELEGRNRIARMVRQERFTTIDRDILKGADGDIIDLSNSVASKTERWRRQLTRGRLNHLNEMGLAAPLGKGRWRLDDDMEQTLRRLGERGDIIKTMHRAMAGSDHGRLMDASSIFDPTSQDAKPVTGVVFDKGVADDVNDRAFIVIDSVEGKPVYVTVGGEDRLSDLAKGQVVTVSPPNIDPKPSDKTIAAIADANGGKYSIALHMNADPSAKLEFVQAHIRRLEALRRAGHVTRQADGVWRTPPDYLSRTVQYEKQMTASRPADIQVHSHLRLAQMKTAIGATWLDEQLRDYDDDATARGFGGEVEAARIARRRFLIKHGLLEKNQQRLTQEKLDTLKARDLEGAGVAMQASLGKTYRPTPGKGRIEGVYTQSIDRPSGRFAVIERAKDFSLTPWREVLERNRGKSVSGLVRRDGISWRLTKGRSIS